METYAICNCFPFVELRFWTMIDYEDFQPLYGFLKYKSKRKEHSYERNIGLKMVESESTRGGRDIVVTL